jgi:hypothetical protein
VGNNSDSHELLSVVTSVHHERVGETLDDWALCLSESLLGVSAGRVGDVDWLSDLDIITMNRHALAKGNFFKCNIGPPIFQILPKIFF